VLAMIKPNKPSSDTNELEYELNTQQCTEVALYMYKEWEKAMQPPLLIWKSFPDWLGSLNEQEGK